MKLRLTHREKRWTTVRNNIKEAKSLNGDFNYISQDAFGKVTSNHRASDSLKAEAENDKQGLKK